MWQFYPLWLHIWLNFTIILTVHITPLTPILTPWASPWPRFSSWNLCPRVLCNFWPDFQTLKVNTHRVGPFRTLTFSKKASKIAYFLVFESCPRGHIWYLMYYQDARRVYPDFDPDIDPEIWAARGFFADFSLLFLQLFLWQPNPKFWQYTNKGQISNFVIQSMKVVTQFFKKSWDWSCERADFSCILLSLASLKGEFVRLLINCACSAKLDYPRALNLAAGQKITGSGYEIAFGPASF